MSSDKRLSKDLIDGFRGIPVANVGDAMDRLNVLDAHIGPVWAGARLVGSALTVTTRSGDNKVIHEAIDVALPGDVLVINGGGVTDRALIGDLIGLRAKAVGIVGFVVDGAVRDAEGLAALDMPVFARGLTPAGPYKNGPGYVGGPAAVGGVAVVPGDLVLGDADGVAVVHSGAAAEVLVKAKAVVAQELSRRAEIVSAMSSEGACRQGDSRR